MENLADSLKCLCVTCSMKCSFVLDSKSVFMKASRIVLSIFCLCLHLTLKGLQDVVESAENNHRHTCIPRPTWYVWVCASSSSVKGYNLWWKPSLAHPVHNTNKHTHTRCMSPKWVTSLFPMPLGYTSQASTPSVPRKQMEREGRESVWGSDVIWI